MKNYYASKTGRRKGRAMGKPQRKTHRSRKSVTIHPDSRMGPKGCPPPRGQPQITGYKHLYLANLFSHASKPDKKDRILRVRVHGSTRTMWLLLMIGGSSVASALANVWEVYSSLRSLAAGRKTRLIWGISPAVTARSSAPVRSCRWIQSSPSKTPRWYPHRGHRGARCSACRIPSGRWTGVRRASPR